MAPENVEELRRRRAEVEVRYRQIMDGVTDFAILLLDGDGNIIEWNAGAEHLLGYGADEVIGRSASLTFTEEDRRAGKGEQEMRQARATGSASDENWAVRKDGSRFWASGVMRALRDAAGQTQGFVKIFRDFTERRHVEQSLRESELRLRAALTAAGMGTWLMHLPSGTDMIDANLQRLLGMPQGQELRTFDEFLGRIDPRDRDAVAEAFARSVQRGDGLAVDFRVLGPAGSVRWLRDRGELIPDAEGRPLYLTGACLEVTAEHQAREELERRVEERSAELRRVQQQVLQAERLAAIGQTMAALAHESGNALQRGQTYIERLRWQLADRPEALALLDELQKAQDDLMRLYTDVQLYAAPVVLEVRSCNVLDVWRTTWTQMAPLHPERDVRFVVEAKDCDTVVEADPFRLEQIFRNLLDNSLAACLDPVVLTLHCAGAELGGAPALQIILRDNGPGLSREQQEQLFVPFYTTKTRGTGLGATIARRLVEAHGGQIAVGPGPGAEIIITLPRRTE